MKKINFIAELCQNHLGKFENIKKMTEKCVENGANTIKLQSIYTKNLTFRPEFENGVKIKNKIYKIKRPYKKEFNRLKKLEINLKDLEKFIKLCEQLNVEPSVTCFSRNDIKSLKNIGFNTIKVASYDCASFKFLKELKSNFNKLIISTGATYDNEIIKASEIVKKNCTFLHCVTIYPTPLNEMHLNRIDFLKKKFGKAGFSDHSLGFGKFRNLASKIAVYKGASILERHITIMDKNKTKDGPVSIQPEDIREVINFSQLSKSDQKIYLSENYNYNIKKTFGLSKRNLSHKEILNRDYYRGRFSSYDKKSQRMIYNWEEVDL